MSESYSLREFIRLTPTQKERLMKRDPEQYEKLRKLTEKMYSKETDQQAAKDMRND
jgi:hypothetical protein